MIRLIVMLLVLAAIVASQLHINIWLAVALIVAVLAGIALAARGKGGGGYVNATAALGKCPYCLKRTKIGAKACHHCGRSLLRENHPPAEPEAPPVVVARLAELDRLREQHLISDYEYSTKRAAMLADL